MTPERIAELRALIEASAEATAERPWTANDMGWPAMTLANTQFCLAARTALPEALDAIERVRKIDRTDYEGAKWVLWSDVLAALEGKL